MRKIKPTTRLFIFLRLVSLITGYNLILSESVAFETGGGSGVPIITHAAPLFFGHDMLFSPEEHKKPREHIFDTGPDKPYFKRPIQKFWQTVYQKNQKPGRAVLAPDRVFFKYQNS